MEHLKTQFKAKCLSQFDECGDDICKICIRSQQEYEIKCAETSLRKSINCIKFYTGIDVPKPNLIDLDLNTTIGFATAKVFSLVPK
jgi:hypothetical protein